MNKQGATPDLTKAQQTMNPHVEGKKATRKRTLLSGGLGVVVVSVLLVFGIPWVEKMLNTVSTDDAFVNGHVTFVAPRVAGQISRVLVDDNNRVHKGDLLVELDKEPYRVTVSEKNVAAYLYTPVALRGAAVGLLSLLRNQGGSVGTSLAQTMQERRDQFDSLRLGKWLDPFNAAARSFLDQTTAPFPQQNGDPVAAQQLALQSLANLRQQQAAALADFDLFWVLAVVLCMLLFVVLLMKRSVAEKGARIGSE